MSTNVLSRQAAFCTLFDSNYLAKGIVMLESLHRHAPGARTHVLCMDEEAYRLLRDFDLPNVLLIQLSDIEDDDLLRVKPSRSRAEYCWTLSPALCRYVMDADKEANYVVYLDADLMFFSSVEPLFAELGDASIAITEHRYSPSLEHLSAYGRFNVQWVLFRRDVTGIACLDRWRSQCIEWCHAWLEAGRLGDQKYLDEWPDLYGRAVHIVRHAGAGVAPWNVFTSSIVASNNGFLINNQLLIFYHYHGLQMQADGRIRRMPPLYDNLGELPTPIYERYETALRNALTRIRQIDPSFAAGLRSPTLVSARRWIQRFAPPGVKNLLRRFRFLST